jgi:carboxylesterase
LGVVGALLAVVLVLVVTVYVWPLGSDSLRAAPAVTLDYTAAIAQAQKVVAADTANPVVRPECRSQLLTHGTRTAKAVLLLHGYTSCPSGLAGLAKVYFDQGYNVWLPRAPRHGTTDPLAHIHVEAQELITYANDGMNVAAGLGDDVGAAGISGGAVLATWLAGHRAQDVRHLLVLSPFYQPGSSQAPGFEVKPLIVLFGFRLLPDHIDDNGFSYSSLSQYLRIARNLGLERDGKLQTVAVVTSANDDFIDHQEAVDLPRQLAERDGATLGIHELPGDLGIGHDVAEPTEIKDHAADLYKTYFDLYEGTRLN